MKSPLALLLTLAACGLLLMAGCSGDDESASDDQSSSEAEGSSDVDLVEGVEVDVLAVDNVFKAEVVTVEAGTEVVWKNKGRNDHNILPVEEGDFGVEIEEFTPGDVYSYRFTEPGTYPYYCSLHGNEEVGMIGTIEVWAP